MIRTNGLKHSYNGNQSFDFPDMNIPKGDKMLLLGQSGCGKTTLLHLLGGLMKPKQGNVHIGSQDISQLGASSLDKFRGKHIGIIFQKPHFIRSLTIGENLLLTQELAGNRRNKDKVKELLEALNIGPKYNSYARNMSQGEQQRAAIARALVNDPDVILADEPTSALDDKNTSEVIGLLEKQASNHKATLIIVTHDTRLKERFENRIEL